MGNRILIVDDDPWIIRMVKTVLDRRGHTVATAADGREALECALSATPDLIITDVLMPGMNGWSLVRALRSHPELSLVPVIFLTGLNSEEDRILGFRLGADDYLPKPFRFEELDLRVDKALRISQRLRERMAGSEPGPVPETAPRSGLAGDLAQVGVSSALTFLAIERKSGVLTIRTTGEDDAGVVFLHAGQPVRAAVGASVHGAEAVYRMLTWRSGTFSFSAAEVDEADEIGMSTTHLLLEGARRIDEKVTRDHTEGRST